MSNLSETERAALRERLLNDDTIIQISVEALTDLPKALKELSAFHEWGRKAVQKGEQFPEAEVNARAAHAADAIRRIYKSGLEIRRFAMDLNFTSDTSPIVDLPGMPTDQLALVRASTAYDKFMQEYFHRDAAKRRAQAAPKPSDDGQGTRTCAKRRRSGATRPLTELQRHALELYGKCNGKIAEIANEMNVTHQTVSQHLAAAWRKVPQLAPKKIAAPGRARRMPTDSRAQVSLSKDAPKTSRRRRRSRSVD